MWFREPVKKKKKKKKWKIPHLGGGVRSGPGHFPHFFLSYCTFFCKSIPPYLVSGRYTNQRYFYEEIVTINKLIVRSKSQFMLKDIISALLSQLPYFCSGWWLIGFRF